MSNNQEITFSIVVPAYNEEAMIGHCMNALLSQTLKPLEIIVVDNNSTDSTVKIAAEFSEVQIIKEQKQGIAHARNAGFNFAKGTIIARIDADSIVPNDWLEKMAVRFSHNSIIGVTGKVSFYDHPFNKLASTIFNFFLRWGNKFISGSYILYGSNMAFYRSIWLKVKEEVENDDKYWEDIDLSMRVRRFGRIDFDRNLIVKASSRSSITSAINIYRYFVHWPRTYSLFGIREKWLSRIVFYILLIFLWIPTFILSNINKENSLY